MKASVRHIFGKIKQVFHEILSYIFAILVMAETAILDGQFVKSNKFETTPFDNVTKFCSAIYEISAFRQSRALNWK